MLCNFYAHIIILLNCFSCLKNCFPLVPVTNAKLKTIIKAVCEKGCLKLGVGNNTHKWTVSKDGGSVSTGEKLGKDVYRIEPNTLDAGSRYILTCLPNG